MKIVLLSIGTRGDMEPFLAIAEMLRDKGHRVVCAFPEQFADLVAEANLEFASLGTGFIDMLESDVGKTALGGKGAGWRKWRANLKLARQSTAINRELVCRQREIVEDEDPDRVIYNGKAVYPVIWGLAHRGQTILISPVPYVHRTKDHAHVAFNGDFGPFLNKLTYSLANFGMVVTVKITARWLKLRRRIGCKEIRHALLTNRSVYTISPCLFPKPVDWHRNIEVLGYHGRSQRIRRPESADLEGFLHRHRNDRILFITFGSMTNPEPEAKTGIILDILGRHKIPAVINTAAGGLVKPDRFDSDFVCFVSQVPYDWIFPRVYGVIHHGGSGTTHLALRHGCATMVVPHVIDQFIWNGVIHGVGAGPRGIRIGRITSKNLEPKVLELIHDASFKRRAEDLARRMAREDFEEELMQTIEEENHGV